MFRKTETFFGVIYGRHTVAAPDGFAGAYKKLRIGKAYSFY